MILSCQNISKAFSENIVLENVNFHIEDYEKAAIVGINGAGKTTLLRIVVGEMTPDSGSVTLSKDKSLGYLAQNGAVDTANTIYDELLSVKQDLIDIERRIRECEASMQTAEGSWLENLMRQYSNLTHAFETGGGYIYRSELAGVLKGLGFAEEEFDKSVSTLSGGQKTRVALGKLLLQKPDLIILDEPTNHLDMNSIAWLETYLLNYKGAVIIVSHDRYFLDKIATKVIEIDQTKSTSFLGNYSDYAVKKEQLRAAAMNAYLNQQREIKHQEEVIEKLRSFNREKSIKRAESREKMLDKIEVLDKPTEARTDMRLTLTPRRQSGGDVLTVENLSKSFGDNFLFDNVSFEIKRGEHVAIIGDNGTGKTTLLKILNQLLPPDKGLFRLGTNVEIGYYDQEHHVLHSEKTLFEEIADDYPTLTNTEIRNVLAAFLFTGEDVFKRICDLSGGERGRVSLAKLMLGNANFLILDEPTNHLDIMSKEILEDALNSYEGTVLYVSHDRYFINRTASRILDLTAHRLVNYIGNYDYYLEKHDVQMAALYASESGSRQNTPYGKSAPCGKSPAMQNGLPGKKENMDTNSGAAASSSPTSSESENKLDWKAQKEEQARIRKKENDLRKCEERIAALEARLKELETEISDPAIGTQAAKLQELAGEQGALSAELETLYEQWETMAE
ncbi:MAG: ABC-F family ATP-binding cassette domain-containing protein [Acetatifactor sp.]|nr:ABC-F family ATP-binding cassette domain-containing protein [Acetatifactor sp.]